MKMLKEGMAGAISGVGAGATFVGGVATAMSLTKAPFPRPGANAPQIRAYFQGNAAPARLSVVGQFLSAVSIAHFTLSVVSVAKQAGSKAKLLRALAVAGGALAATSLAVSASTAGALTVGERDDRSVESLHRFLFLSGGAIHNVGLALLTGALGAAGLRSSTLPEPLNRAAIVAATAAAATPLTLGSIKGMAAIPLARVSCLVVMGIAGVKLAKKN
jgi:hypothetical protein